ncbi:glutamate racemase [Patescibacteria group bacterium]|nr:glutamate racemase [Patescibacteria group bacterium]MBU4367825.1 glutamate racemase [Patescibacteria group bacterium]MBU4461535.1 glutamate racemase [Patescibacteria group bacterium]MCG2700324.1 glutamate racemase [Candidatus Parcubacteria bacterium]
MIGVFDSGVGGLTVVKEIFKYLPEYQIIYFGDTARLPYGTKGADFVRKYSKKITEWLLNRGAKIIVVACNTSSAWAADFLKKEFPNLPIFEMIEPAVKEAIKKTKNKRIGIIGTPGTVKSGIYKKKLAEIDGELKFFAEPCPLFVSLVEEGLIDGKITEEVAKKYLLPLKKKNIDTLILGCTHYPLLEKTIKKIMGKNIEIINPARSLARGLKKFLENNPEIEKKLRNGSVHKFQFSDEPYNFQKINHLCFDKKIKPIVKDPFLS